MENQTASGNKIIQDIQGMSKQEILEYFINTTSESTENSKNIIKGLLTEEYESSPHKEKQIEIAEMFLKRDLESIKEGFKDYDEYGQYYCLLNILSSIKSWYPFCKKFNILQSELNELKNNNQDLWNSI